MEYQKCELSHCHIFLFLTAQNCTLNSDWINNYIQAEFPKPALNSDDKLTEMMKKIIMHNPCEELNSASSCMKPDKYSYTVCLKRYSQLLQPHTIVNENEYSTYQQSENEYYVMKQMNSVKMIMFNE